MLSWQCFSFSAAGHPPPTQEPLAHSVCPPSSGQACRLGTDSETSDPRSQTSWYSPLSQGRQQSDIFGEQHWRARPGPCVGRGGSQTTASPARSPGTPRKASPAFPEPLSKVIWFWFFNLGPEGYPDLSGLSQVSQALVPMSAVCLPPSCPTLSPAVCSLQSYIVHPLATCCCAPRLPACPAPFLSHPNPNGS